MRFEKLFLSLITSAALLIANNSAFSDSSTKNRKPVENNEYNSLSAPTSKSPHDIKDQSVNNRNLSKRPPVDPSTNNKPFDGDIKKKTSSHQSKHD